MEFLKAISPREYQEKIFQICKAKNCLVVLPTGLGKTLIALMLAIERLKSFPTQKVVFLAPTKPLAEQHLSYFKNHLPELFAELTLFTGTIAAEKRKKLFRVSDIIFSTPQCLANDIKNNLYDLKEVCLLIEDEAHRCVKNYDYNFIAQRYINQSANPRIMGLTASPGYSMEKIKEICRNLSIEEVEIRTRESEDVKEYLQEMKIEKISIAFPPELEQIKQILLEIFNRYVEEMRRRKVLFELPTKGNLIKLQKSLMASLARGNRNFNYLLGVSACAQAVKLQHALELLETQTLTNFNNYLKKLFTQASKKQSKGVVKLVADSQFNFIYMLSNELLAKGFEHPKLKRLTELIQAEQSKNQNLKIIVFTQFRETAKAVAEDLNKLSGIKAKVFIGQAKKSGTGMSQKEQKALIENFSQGKINVLVATSIAEEGLDIPEINLVIFYETIPSAIRKIQRMGRTARLMKGKVIMLITKNTRDETHYYVSRAREKKMHTLISELKTEMAGENVKASNTNKSRLQKDLKDYFE